MHWLTSPFCVTPSRETDDISLHKIRQHQTKRRLTRARKLRYLEDGDVNPHPAVPLPLPALSFLLTRDASASKKGTSSPKVREDIYLPSPARKGKEEGRDEASSYHDFKFRSPLACEDCQRNRDPNTAQRFQVSPRKTHNTNGLQESHAIPMQGSGSTSSLAIPGRSPYRNGHMCNSHHMYPQGNRVWSAPEMPAFDMNLQFSPRMHANLYAFSVDNSPVQSPTVSAQQRRPNGPILPSAKTLTIDTTTARPVNLIHPLPLPRGANSPSPQWKKGKLIGRGTYGSVYIASNRETGALCAMKEVELAFDDPKSAECIKQLQQEIKVLSTLKHPNIVQYYGSEICGDRFYIYLEYVHPGSISKYIHEHGEAMTESVVRNFTRHILSALAYLHSKKTIHRDIKGANLLVDGHGVVKLADFGMAKHLSGPGSNLSMKGSPYWMAPELLQFVMQKDANSDLALAVDIWSLGCTIIEMLDGKPPWFEYEGAAAMFKVMKETPPIPETLSPEGKDFLRCCFRRNPAERPTARLLLGHRFLKTQLTLDVTACTTAIKGMAVTDTPRSVIEQFNHKNEYLPSSPHAQPTVVQLPINSIHLPLSPLNMVKNSDLSPPARSVNDSTMRLTT